MQKFAKLQFIVWLKNKSEFGECKPEYPKSVQNDEYPTRMIPTRKCKFNHLYVDNIFAN